MFTLGVFHNWTSNLWEESLGQIYPNIRDKKYIVNHNKPPRKNSTKLFVIFRKKEIKNYEFYASLSILVMYNTFFKNVDYYQINKISSTIHWRLHLKLLSIIIIDDWKLCNWNIVKTFIFRGDYIYKSSEKTLPFGGI